MVRQLRPTEQKLYSFHDAGNGGEQRSVLHDRNYCQVFRARAYIQCGRQHSCCDRKIDQKGEMADYIAGDTVPLHCRMSWFYSVYLLRAYSPYTSSMYMYVPSVTCYVVAYIHVDSDRSKLNALD